VTEGGCRTGTGAGGGGNEVELIRIWGGDTEEFEVMFDVIGVVRECSTFCIDSSVNSIVGLSEEFSSKDDIIL
jgi:hypothetical protein